MSKLIFIFAGNSKPTTIHTIYWVRITSVHTKIDNKSMIFLSSLILVYVLSKVILSTQIRNAMKQILECTEEITQMIFLKIIFFDSKKVLSENDRGWWGIDTGRRISQTPIVAGTMNYVFSKNKGFGR